MTRETMRRGAAFPSTTGATPIAAGSGETEPVRLCCRTGCGKCAGVRRWLERLGVSVVVCDVLQGPLAQEEVVRLGFSSLPVVATPDGWAAHGVQSADLLRALPWLRQLGTHANQS